MTPGQAAVIIWALGIAPIALTVHRHIRFLENVDVLTLCDECRYRRRETYAVVGALPPALWVVIIVAASALWPGLVAVKLFQTAILGKPWRHRCVRPAA